MFLGKYFDFFGVNYYTSNIILRAYTNCVKSIIIDYNTLERQIRRSSKFYSDICKQKEVSEKMIKKYF